MDIIWVILIVHLFPFCVQLLGCSSSNTSRARQSLVSRPEPLSNTSRAHWRAVSRPGASLEHPPGALEVLNVAGMRRKAVCQKGLTWHHQTPWRNVSESFRRKSKCKNTFRGVGLLSAVDWRTARKVPAKIATLSAKICARIA